MRRRNAYAVVTGASSGIGEEFARRLAAEGYDLVLAARRIEVLNELAARLKKIGTRVIVVEADLSSISGCDKLLDIIKGLRVHMFINNAGFGDCGYFIEQEIDKELAMIDVNIKAVHYLTKKMLRYMNQNNGGYILNVASSAGLIHAGPYMATYYATKAYVTSLTRAIAEELKEHGSNIYIGCLCPGPVNTSFNEVANVNFALKGISASYCVDYAISNMKKRKVVIIPTASIKLALFGERLIPDSLYIKLTAHQQKKKL